MKGRAAILIPHATIVVLAAAVYLNSLPNEFIWDDHRAITGNYLIKRIRHIPQLFVTDLYTSTGQPAGNFRPLLLSSFALDFAVFGARPWAYRAVNVILHAAASLLVFLVLRSLLGERGEVPFLSAVIFAAHPVHVEAVAVVMGRAELLAGCLVLGAWLVFLRRGRWALPIGLSLFFLALLSKETAAVFPLLLAVGAIVCREPSRRVARDLLLAGAVFLLYLPIRFHALGGLGPPENLIILRGMGLLDRIGVAMAIFREYVLLCAFPVKLSLDYQFLAPPAQFSLLAIASGAALLLAGAAIVAVTWRRRPALSLGFLIFFIPLLPVSNLIPIGEIFGERLLYLPSIGACLAVGFACSRLPRAMGWVMVILVVSCGSALTVARNGVLAHQGLAAFSTLRHYPLSAKAHADAGNYYQGIGLGGRARRHYEASRQIRPRFVVPREGIGLLLLDEGRLDEAERHFRSLVEEHPDSSRMANRLGEVLLLRGDVEGAGRYFRLALKLLPSEPSPRLNLGVLTYQAGELREAARWFKEVLQYHPDHVQALENLGAIHAELGRYGEAARVMRQAVRLGSASAASWRLLGECEEISGNRRAARRAFEMALRLLPGQGEELNRGLILLNLRRKTEAEFTFRRIRKADPGDAQAAFHHGRALEDLRRTEEAIQAYKDFLQLYEGTNEAIRQTAAGRIRDLRLGRLRGR